MTNSKIWVGNGTHTGMMLGYCPDCGLYHGSPAARAACARLLDVSTAGEERAEWAVLKRAVASEGGAAMPGAVPLA